MSDNPLTPAQILSEHGSVVGDFLHELHPAIPLPLAQAFCTTVAGLIWDGLRNAPHPQGFVQTPARNSSLSMILAFGNLTPDGGITLTRGTLRGTMHYVLWYFHASLPKPTVYPWVMALADEAAQLPLCSVATITADQIPEAEKEAATLLRLAAKMYDQPEWAEIMQGLEKPSGLVGVRGFKAVTPV